VLRDGKHIATLQKSDTTPDQVIGMMVGRSLNTMYPKRTSSRGPLLMSVRNASRAGEFDSVSFDLYQGEILGFAGLIGAGRRNCSGPLRGYLWDQESHHAWRSNGEFQPSFQALARGAAYRRRTGRVKDWRCSCQSAKICPSPYW
jgi:ABC-type sugar transport system ATPase subunit